MREQRTKAQVKRKNKRNPDLTHPPIICNNNTMDIEFDVFGLFKVTVTS